MDEAVRIVLQIPIFRIIGIVVDFLPHFPPWRKAHAMLHITWTSVPKLSSSRDGAWSGIANIIPCPLASHYKLGHPFRESLFECLALHGVDEDLQTTELAFACYLLFDTVALTQRHCYELADNPFFDAITVNPRLVWGYSVVLRLHVEPLAQQLTGHGIDFSCGDLYGKGVPPPVINIGCIEVYPHGFSLVHRQHHSTTRYPLFGCGSGKIVDKAHREVVKPRWKAVIVTVIGYSQRALELNVQRGLEMYIRKPEYQILPACAQLDHNFSFVISMGMKYLALVSSILEHILFNSRTFCIIKQMTQEKIGHRIKQIRCAKGLSQEELARRVDLSRTAITKIESGSQDVRFAELKKLADALNISLGYLVEEKRPVRESSDEEFFRVNESDSSLYHASAENKLRTMLLIILERCAGDPGMNEHRLASIVRQADQTCLQSYGETISGIPYPSTTLLQTIHEALELMTSTKELMRIDNKDNEAVRHLPLAKAELLLLNAAEYIIIEKAICLASS